MNPAFKWRHFQADMILQCVRWYCKYGISYRDLEEMSERGLSVEKIPPVFLIQQDIADFLAFDQLPVVILFNKNIKN